MISEMKEPRPPRGSPSYPRPTGVLGNWALGQQTLKLAIVFAVPSPQGNGVSRSRLSSIS
jgi:hypothetical protein